MVSFKLILFCKNILKNCFKGNNGCRGGNIENAFKFIVESKGISTAKAYPYEARVGF